MKITFTGDEELDDVPDGMWDADAIQVPEDVTFSGHEFRRESPGYTMRTIIWRCKKCRSCLILPRSETPDPMGGVQTCPEIIVARIMEE